MSTGGSFRTRWTAEDEALLRHWSDVCCSDSAEHAREASRLQQRHYYTGGVAAVLSGIASAGFFVMFGSQCTAFETYVALAGGVVSGLATLATAINSFFGLEQRAERHKITSESYASLFRILQQTLTSHEARRGSPDVIIGALRRQIDTAGRDAPMIRNYVPLHKLDQAAVVERPRNDSVAGTTTTTTTTTTLTDSTEASSVDVVDSVEEDGTSARMRAEQDYGVELTMRVAEGRGKPFLLRATNKLRHVFGPSENDNNGDSIV